MSSNVLGRIGQAGSSWLITAAIVVVGLATAGVLLYGLKEAFEAGPEIVVSVIAVVGGFATTQWLQRRTERERIRETRRDKLTPHYENLLKFVRRAGKEGGDSPKIMRQNEQFWIELTNTMILWASPELVSAWANFMREIEVAQESHDGGTTFVREYTKVLHAIRSELGHKDTGLPVRDLLKLFMTDSDKSIPEDLRF